MVETLKTEVDRLRKELEACQDKCQAMEAVVDAAKAWDEARGNNSGHEPSLSVLFRAENRLIFWIANLKEIEG